MPQGQALDDRSFPAPPSGPPRGLGLVVAALAACLVFFFLGIAFSQRSHRPSTRSLAQNGLMRLSVALEQFDADNGRYPSDAEGLNALVVRPGNLASWRGPYIQPPLLPDPWGRPYLYRRAHNGWLIVSTGPDGVEGTTDDMMQSLPAP